MEQIIEQFVEAMTDSERTATHDDIVDAFGAEYIASGIDRDAYRLGEWVVKLSQCDDMQTQLERWNYMRLTMEGHVRGDWAIPLMSFMDSPRGLVSISEFIDGLMDIDDDATGSNSFNVRDCHGGNFIKALDGKSYIIDLGYAHGYHECVLKGHEMINSYDCDHGCI